MMKPVARKSPRGRIQCYELDCAGIVAQAATKANCQAEWERRAAAVSVYQYARRYDWAADGSLFTLYHTGNGWCYDIVHPGSPHASTCQMGADRREALRYYESHLDQYGRAPLPIARPGSNPLSAVAS